MIIEAEGLLTSAAQMARFGRFQCEAAIQSVHVQRPITGRTNYAALRTLYDALFGHFPSIGVVIARAAVILESGDATTALDALEALPAERVAGYQPYWVTLARILAVLGRPDEAADALDRAITLTPDETIRAFLRQTHSPLSQAGGTKT
jgi:RNA polymerase sigma-70 factor (ECF subfamily)